MRIRTWAMPLALAGASGALLLGAWALGGGSLAAFAAEPARPLLLAVTMAMFLAGPWPRGVSATSTPRAAST
jgi:hypothetical protein